MAKPLIALELGTKKPGDSANAGPPGLGSSKADAIKEMFEAAKRGDWEAAQMAFHDAYMACSDEGEDEDAETDPFASDDDDEE